MNDRTIARKARHRMLQEIEMEVRATSELIGRHTLDPRIISALEAVPRHRFVPASLYPFAYDNRPLSIGNGQTISQPYIVAIMSDLLALSPDDTVLEIGTGSGYQAAVLSRLVRQVYSIEIIAELAEKARLRLRKLGYDNVEIKEGNGRQGWPEHAPYDAIIVTAAAAEIPPALLRQLKPAGRMIIPVGPPYQDQELILITKDSSEVISQRCLLPVVFVPLTGQQDEKCMPTVSAPGQNHS